MSIHLCDSFDFVFTQKSLILSIMVDATCKF